MKEYKILIIGNGGTGLSGNGSQMINSNTGNFLLELKKAGIGINFCQFYVPFVKDSDLQNFDLAKNGIKTTTIKNSGKKGLLSLLISIMRVIRKNDFVYLFFPGKLPLLVGLMCVFLRNKFGIYLRGEIINHKIIFKYILKKAQFILTVSPSFIDDYKTPRNRVKVIKPMIAFNKNDITKKELVSKNTFNFLFVGRVEERKGIFELIKIADYLTNAGINFRFHIVGGGVLLNKLRTDQFQGKINRNLNFIGQVGSLNELRSYYKNTDALILTTHDEGFPRVLYEAMIFGVPIYTTMVGGIPGRMKNYYNCIEIPLRDGKRAGEIIKVTISNIELLNKITANASKTVSDILTNEKSHSLLLKNELDENFK